MAINILLSWLQWIIHDWEDEECVELLRRSYEATPMDGKVLTVDAVVEERKEGDNDLWRRLGLLFDVAMMDYRMGGKERIEQEFTESSWLVWLMLLYI